MFLYQQLVENSTHMWLVWLHVLKKYATQNCRKKTLLFHNSFCIWQDCSGKCFGVLWIVYFKSSEGETSTVIDGYRDCGNRYACQIAELSLQHRLASYGIDCNCTCCLLGVGKKKDGLHFRVEIWEIWMTRKGDCEVWDSLCGNLKCWLSLSLYYLRLT